MNELPSTAVAQSIERAAGRTPVSWKRVRGGGYTPAERWLVEFADGARAFAKVGTIERTAEWLRIEHRAYSEIHGAFIPRMLGWADGAVPALLLEDLSGARWPPPWDESLVNGMLGSLAAIASTRCPPWARQVDAQEQVFSGWTAIAKDPEPFLGLGLASRPWLEGALPLLIEHEHPPEASGNALLHFDVRSDNMCFSADRALLVDWNWIGRGNPLFDVAAWLPSLHFEGGPAPEEVRPEAGVFAAALAGYFCAHAPQPMIPDAPHVRRVQFQQATTALPWAARWLGLPLPDGPACAQRG